MSKQNRRDWKSDRLHFKRKTDVNEVAHSESSYSLQGLQHDDAVSSDHLKNNPKQNGVITLLKAKAASYLGTVVLTTMPMLLCCPPGPISRVSSTTRFMKGSNPRRIP